MNPASPPARFTPDHAAGSGPLPGPVARHWVDRWERMADHHAVRREDRFDAVVQVVEHLTAGQDAPVAVDLGCGPGSLAARLTNRLPRAQVVAVDADPVLLGLGRACHGARLRFVQALAPSPGWLDALELTRPADAVVTSSALHYLAEPELADVLRDCARLLRPGGILVNADHLVEPGLGHDVQLALGRRSARSPSPQPGSGPVVTYSDDWPGWWSAAAADPYLAGLFEARRQAALPAHGEGHVPLGRHVDLLRDAGFLDVRTVWQVGISRVLIAVR